MTGLGALIQRGVSVVVGKFAEARADYASERDYAKTIEAITVHFERINRDGLPDECQKFGLEQALNLAEAHLILYPDDASVLLAGIEANKEFQLLSKQHQNSFVQQYPERQNKAQVIVASMPLDPLILSV